MNNVYDYPAPIWQRFSAPTLAGTFEPGPGVIAAQAGNPAAKSLLRLTLRLADGQVQQTRFQAYGCPTAIAVGQWLAEWLLATPPVRWSQLNAALITQALEIPPDRAHCALMGEDLVRALQQQVES